MFYHAQNPLTLAERAEDRSKEEESEIDAAFNPARAAGRELFVAIQARFIGAGFRDSSFRRVRTPETDAQLDNDLRRV